ncbi:hypothetical protein J4443_03390 [Candidatus Woesearchaeota archaeon]|nr:hypothetical protein [Candidatus Woesearchaeota archaeon]
MALRNNESRKDHSSFVESMLKSAEEDKVIKPKSLYDSVDIGRVEELTEEIKKGNPAYRAKKR